MFPTQKLISKSGTRNKPILAYSFYRSVNRLFSFDKYKEKLCFKMLYNSVTKKEKLTYKIKSTFLEKKTNSAAHRVLS